MDLQYAEGYFATAVERYKIKLQREVGLRPPWTKDKEFQQWRFCNVHREDDRTTVWFREHVREPLSRIHDPSCASQGSIGGQGLEFIPCNCEKQLHVLKSTIAFRWFNRIETGRMIQDLLVDRWDTEEARRRLTGVSPVVTGAYIIKGYDGYTKLDGVLKCIDEAFPKLEPMLSMWQKLAQGGQLTLRTAWNDLTTLNYMGGFMAYEAVSDLRWTPVLSQATDIMTWANAGPGCARGLSWAVDGKIGRFNVSRGHQEDMLPLMQELLEMSKYEIFWPQEWKHWEMREVEHWSCEFDKYCRSRSGESMKRRFSYGV